MPFCRKCSPGEYQSEYDQIQCNQCPPNTISPRGSASIDNCHPKQYQPCSQLNVCGSHGTCQEVSNPFLYSCSCEDGFVGSHCEHQVRIGRKLMHDEWKKYHVDNSWTYVCRPHVTMAVRATIHKTQALRSFAHVQLGSLELIVKLALINATTAFA